MWASGMQDTFIGCLAVVLAAGVAIGAFLVWVIPILWAWIKPWLHAVTG